MRSSSQKKAKKIPSALEQSKRYARGLAASLPAAPPPYLARLAAEGPACDGLDRLARCRRVLPGPHHRRLQPHGRRRAGPAPRPYGEAKTIIFYVDDDHADRLVPILK
jgi:hypothetical protein